MERVELGISIVQAIDILVKIFFRKMGKTKILSLVTLFFASVLHEAILDPSISLSRKKCNSEFPFDNSIQYFFKLKS